MGTKDVRLGILSPSPLISAGLRVAFANSQQFEVVAAASTIEEGHEMVENERLGMLLAMTQLPDGSIMKLLPEIRSTRRSLPIVLLAESLSDAFCAHALKLDVRGFVLLADDLPCVRAICSAVYRGEFQCSPGLAGIFVNDRNGRRVARKSVLNDLSSIQFEVLERLARGFSVKEISREMASSIKSVDSHKYRIMKKLNVHDRVELARLAIREGIIDP